VRAASSPAWPATTRSAGHGGGPDPDIIYATIRDGVTPAAAHAAIVRAIAEYPNVELLSRDEVSRRAAASIDPALRLYYSLFGLMILVALFGIANTQTLSVLERVRETGLLRAIGMDRRQVRSMIRWEATAIAGAGTALGLGLGAFLGWATMRALGQPAGSVPVGSLLVCAVAAVLAAALVTVPPARRAARVDPLHALATE